MKKYYQHPPHLWVVSSSWAAHRGYGGGVGALLCFGTGADNPRPTFLLPAGTGWSEEHQTAASITTMKRKNPDTPCNQEEDETKTPHKVAKLLDTDEAEADETAKAVTSAEDEEEDEDYEDDDEMYERLIKKHEIDDLIKDHFTHRVSRYGRKTITAAIQENDVEKIEAFLAYAERNGTPCDWLRGDPLCEAAGGGHIRILSMLLDVLPYPTMYTETEMFQEAAGAAISAGHTTALKLIMRDSSDESMLALPETNRLWNHACGCRRYKAAHAIAAPYTKLGVPLTCESSVFNFVCGSNYSALMMHIIAVSKIEGGISLMHIETARKTGSSSLVKQLVEASSGTVDPAARCNKLLRAAVADGQINIARFLMSVPTVRAAAGRDGRGHVDMEWPL